MRKILRGKFKILKQRRCRVSNGHKWQKLCYLVRYELDFILENCANCDLKRGRVLSVKGVEDTLFIQIV